MAEYNDPIWWHKNSPARGEFGDAPDVNIYLEFSENSKVEQWTACALEQPVLVHILALPLRSFANLVKLLNLSVNWLPYVVYSRIILATKILDVKKWKTKTLSINKIAYKLQRMVFKIDRNLERMSKEIWGKKGGTLLLY